MRATARHWFAAGVLLGTCLSFSAPLQAQTPPPPAPRCCGETCGAGRPCCTGTVCSTTGRCVPAACLECGDRGCDPDFTTCTATCGPIRCCLSSCASDSDCCTGTVCRGTSAGRQCVPEACSECTAQGRSCTVATGCEAVCNAPVCCNARCASDRDCCGGTSCQTVSSGEHLCLPRSCEGCAGMTPHCRIDDNCTPVCIAPVTCGNTCASNAECGPGSLCREFSSGVSRCVPAAFERVCTACGTGGCRFEPTACAVVCGP